MISLGNMSLQMYSIDAHPSSAVDRTLAKFYRILN